MASATDAMSETEVLDLLRSRGFTANFVPEADGLRCQETAELFAPEDCTIVDTVRFEGLTDVSDESIVYAIETRTGCRGVLVDAFGPYASPELASYIDRIPVRRTSTRPG